MKKILLLLVLIFNFAFSATNSSFEVVQMYMSSYKYTTDQFGYVSSKWQVSGSIYWNSSTRIIINFNSPRPNGSDPCIGSPSVESNKAIIICSNGSFKEVANPDPLGGSRCRDLFSKDGVGYTCNPNTNEATPIPNSNGTILDENGDDKPNCNIGYDSYSVPTMTSAGGTQSDQSYNVWGCAAVTSTGDTGTNNSGSSTSTDSGTSSGSGSSSGSSGSTSSGSGTGTTGTDTGSSSGTGGTSSGSSGTSTDTTSSSGGGTGTTSGTGTGSSGTGSGTGTTGTDTGTGTDGTGTTGSDTGTGTTDTSGNPDTNGTDDTGTGNCGDANLTLQEKMLCQLKQGNDLTNSKLGSINTKLTNIDDNLTSFNNQINASMFSSTTSKDLFSSIRLSSESILNEANEAYTNVSTGLSTIKQNYQDLKDFIDGKKALNSTVEISNVSQLTCTNYNIFGKTKCYDCFFNQDLDFIFSKIAPFITFFLNIYFMFLSIRLFMRYALNSGVR